jgi:hypothetical protein
VTDVLNEDSFFHITQYKLAAARAYPHAIERHIVPDSGSRKLKVLENNRVWGYQVRGIANPVLSVKCRIKNHEYLKDSLIFYLSVLKHFISNNKSFQVLLVFLFSLLKPVQAIDQNWLTVQVGNDSRYICVSILNTIRIGCIVFNI